MIKLAEGLLEYTGNYFNVYDEEFQSSISFDANRESLKEAFESPEYFTDEVLISINHYLETGELDEAHSIVSDIESSIVGRGGSDNISYAFDLIGDGFEWIGYTEKKQIGILGENIRKHCYKRRNRNDKDNR